MFFLTYFRSIFFFYILFEFKFRFRVDSIFFLDFL